MQQAIDAIKAKYNVSDEDAKKVLGVLIAAEHQRQTGNITPRGGLISGASMPGTGGKPPSGMKSADARGIDAGDLLGIAGSLLGGGGQQSGGGLGGLVGGLLGGQSSQQSGGADILGIVGDLIGGASNHPSQGGGGADLGGVLNGLLGGQPGHQTNDPLGSLLGGLMGGGGQQAQPTQQGGGAGDLLGLLGGLVGGAGGQQGAQGGDLGGLLGSLLGGGGAVPQQSQQPSQGGGATFYSPQDVGHQQSGHQPSSPSSGAHLGEGTPGGSDKKDYGSIGDAMHKMSDAVHAKPDKLGKMSNEKGKPGDMPSGKEKK